MTLLQPWLQMQQVRLKPDSAKTKGLRGTARRSTAPHLARDAPPVSSGVGTVVLPVRINCPPEVVALTLEGL